ncbi:MAG: GTPase domain-containing protein [Lentisphaeria bacterium]|nr:GTPase domain-containing protein [Lentisphaeria bacterium]
MPIPLLVWIGVAVAVALIGGGVVIACLSGKSVLFIGMMGSGKTTAIHGFQAVSKEDKNWKADNSTPGTMSDSKEYDVLGFKACIDTSGGQQFKKSWPPKIEKADWVFYFFDITQLDETRGKDHEKTRYWKLVKADLRDIACVCKEKSKPVLVIATHTDRAYDKEKAKGYCEDILAELVSLNYGYVEGSLLNYASASKLSHLIEKKVEEIEK